jgi:glutamyl-tRNA reductase
MFIAVAGISYHNTPIELRERLALSEREITALLPELCRSSHFEECCVLSTCNRTEFYLTTGYWERSNEIISEFIENKTELNAGEARKHMYIHTLEDAVRHLFRVVAGLDSMVLGETQIAGQVKKAYELAREAGTTGAVLNALFQQALATGKYLRAETGIDQCPVSIPYIAAELMKRTLTTLEGRSVLLIGAGKMSATAMTHLREYGIAGVIVSNRSPARAKELAEEYGGRAVSFADLPACLAEADIVISGTSAPHCLITAEMTERAMAARHGKPLLLIDMASPRDIEPLAGEIPGATLFDLDDFQSVEDESWARRRRAADRGEKIVVKECENFMARLAQNSVTPIIRALTGRYRDVAAAEVQLALRRLGSYDERQADAMNQLAASIVGKLLHQPINSLRCHALKPEGHVYAKMAESLFGLSKEGEADP